MTEEKILTIQKNLNKQLASIFLENRIKNVRLISLGNSIGSGYSMVRTIKPLLLRNESIEGIMNDSDIGLERYNFARAQNNSDEHLYDWLITNIKESEINKMNRVDYGTSPISMATHGLDEEIIERLYPLHLEEDKGLQDLVLESHDGLANIIIYNGCTGSFLDGITRNGKPSQMLTYGIKRDIKSLEATLKYIQVNNRKNNMNTQVYICGAPRILCFSEIINHQLKQIASKYANTTYVKPLFAKLIYPKCDGKGVSGDIHYDELQYLKLNNNILRAIDDNYQINKAMINIDRRLFQLSSSIELEKKDLHKNNSQIQELMNKILEKERQMFTSNKKLKNFYKTARNYLLERQAYDFYYIGKTNIKDTVNIKQKSK